MSERRFGEVCGVDGCGGMLVYGGSAANLYKTVVCEKCGNKMTHPPRRAGEVCGKNLCTGKLRAL